MRDDLFHEKADGRVRKPVFPFFSTINVCIETVHSVQCVQSLYSTQLFNEISSEKDIHACLRQVEKSSIFQDLDDLRSRCLQMEKTMKWWSDCTANWREKWSKVRAERNRYKEEAKRLGARLDERAREVAEVHREKEVLRAQLEQMQQHRQRQQEEQQEQLPSVQQMRERLEQQQQQQQQQLLQQQQKRQPTMTRETGTDTLDLKVGEVGEAHIDLTVISANNALPSPLSNKETHNAPPLPATAAADAAAPSHASESADSGMNEINSCL